MIRPARPTAVLTAAVLGGFGAVALGASPASAYTPPAQRPGLLAYNSAGLALTPAGNVRSWGYNENGELGRPGSSTPTPGYVLGLTGTGRLDKAVAVSAGGADFSLALRADGTVASWGNDRAGDLGDGTTTSNTTANPVPRLVHAVSGAGSLTDVVSISAGGDHGLALRNDGTVVAWGFDAQGQLGNASNTQSTHPVVVHGSGSSDELTSVTAVVAGDTSSYAITAGGEVYAWGGNFDGELGDGSGDFSNVPVQVVGVGGSGVLEHVVAVAAGQNFALALRSDGSVVAWGSNAVGQLGDGIPANTEAPVVVSSLHNVSAIAASLEGSNSMAVTSSGAVYGWGDNSEGQIGDGTMTQRNVPMAVAHLGAGSDVVQVAPSGSDSAALTSSGKVYDWGYDGEGNLGDGTTTGTEEPAQLHSSGVIAAPPLFLRSAPVLGGSDKVGHKLTVTHGKWGLPATRYAYSWLRNGAPIEHATGTSYTLTSHDEGYRISVRVAAARSGYPANHYVTRYVIPPAPKCGTGSIKLGAGHEDDAAGHAGFILTFHNQAKKACSLEGYPGLTALDKHGKVLAHAKGTSTGFFGGSRNGVHAIAIAPGATVSAAVEWVAFDKSGNTCAFGSSVLAAPPGLAAVHVKRQPSLCNLQVHPVVYGHTGSN